MHKISFLTILNICEYQRWYCTDLACPLFWDGGKHLSPLSISYNPCIWRVNYGATQRINPSCTKLHSTTFLIMHSLVLIEKCRVKGLKVNWKANYSFATYSFLSLPFLNCWLRGPGVRYQTAVCIWSHRGR